MHVGEKQSRMHASFFPALCSATVSGPLKIQTVAQVTLNNRLQ